MFYFEIEKKFSDHKDAFKEVTAELSAIKTILVAKGITTIEELMHYLIISRAAVDQALAERDVLREKE